MSFWQGVDKLEQGKQTQCGCVISTGLNSNTSNRRDTSLQPVVFLEENVPSRNAIKNGLNGQISQAHGIENTRRLFATSAAGAITTQPYQPRTMETHLPSPPPSYNRTLRQYFFNINMIILQPCTIPVKMITLSCKSGATGSNTGLYKL